ncbi:MAG: acyl-CoA dehydrogenase family protein [Nitrospirae bacterium]|nr:acyl-CoA dehydrogenase family protein [Nitrospirota bacterium]
MIDFTPPPGVEEALEKIRWLGRERLRPLGMECDVKHEPLPPDHPFFKEFLALNLPLGIRPGVKLPGEETGEKMLGRFRVLVGEEIGYWDQGVALSLPGPGLASPPVMLMGTPDQKAAFYRTYVDKSMPHWGAFALTEPGAGSDVAQIRSTARKDGRHYVLNGEKMFITNGARADWVIWFATVDPNQGRAGHRAFLIRKGTPGFRVARIDKKMGLRGSETAGLICEDCRVSEDDLLGGEKHYERKEGFKGAMGTFDMTRPTVAVMAVGIARAAFDHARSFVREVLVLSRPVPRSHRVLERLSMMRQKIETARLLCWRAAWLLDKGKPNSIEASMAKAYAPVAALEVIRSSMEVMAEAGVRQDRFVEKLFRDIKVFDIFEGTGQVQRLVIAKKLAGYPGSSG